MTPAGSTQVGPIIASIGVPWALLAAFKLSAAFQSTFAEFGGELPWITRALLLPWVPIGLAFVCLAVVTAISRVTASGAVILAITLVALQPTVFLLAMYLPLFAIADAVR